MKTLLLIVVALFTAQTAKAEGIPAHALAAMMAAGSTAAYQAQPGVDKAKLFQVLSGCFAGQGNPSTSGSSSSGLGSSSLGSGSTGGGYSYP